MTTSLLVVIISATFKGLNMKKSLSKKLATGRSMGINGTSCKLFVPFSYSNYGNSRFSIGSVTFGFSRTGGLDVVEGSIPPSWFIDLNADAEGLAA